MRSWWRTVAVGLLAVSLGGCDAGVRSSRPVTRVVAAPAVRAAVVPEAGTCHRDVAPISYASTYAPVACTVTHRAETVSVQTFATAPPVLPAAGSPALLEAFDVCDADVRAFVGVDWRGGNLSVQVVTPSPEDWRTGSRWFRCDVFQIAPLDNGTTKLHPDDHPMERASSLAGALRSTSPLSYTCFDEDEYEQFQPVGCAKPHRFEYAGIWTTTYPTRAAVDQNSDQVLDRCAGVMLAHAHATDRDRDIVLRAGMAYRSPSPEAWLRGDRGIRCFVWHDDRPRSRAVIADPTGTVGA